MTRGWRAGLWVLCALALGAASPRPEGAQPCSTDATYAAVSHLLLLARAQSARGDYAHANTLLADGIGTLGRRYASSAAVDDTGYRLVIAGDRDRKGDARGAAGLRESVLEARLQMYQIVLRGGRPAVATC